MPYKESFSWTMVPLFDSNVAGPSGGAASPSSPLAPSISGSGSLESVAEPATKIKVDGKLAKHSNGSSLVVEISNLNKVKESYTEDSLQVCQNSSLFFHCFLAPIYLFNHDTPF